MEMTWMFIAAVVYSKKSASVSPILTFKKSFKNFSLFVDFVLDISVIHENGCSLFGEFFKYFVNEKK